jgi:hypothetical protein
MAGAALSAFGDVILNTSYAVLGGPERLINEIQKKTYPLSYALKGRDAGEVLQGGREIRDQIFLDEVSTFEEVLPGEDSTWQYPQVESEYTVRWRYWQDHYEWLDQTVDLNDGDPKLMYKREAYKLHMRAWTSMINGADGTLFRAPNTATMEAAAGKSTYSLPVHMNEQTNTLFNTVTTAAPGGAWTTVQNISPSTKTRWKSAQQSYPTALGSTPDSVGNYFYAFRRMWNKIHFQMPPTKQQYFENSELGRQVIFASDLGVANYEHLLRSQNDRLLANYQDPSFNSPTFNGIPVVYVSDLDDVALYSASGAVTTLGTEANANVAGPRFYWSNFNYLKLIFHSKWYFRLMNEIQPERQPNVHIVPIQTWCNLVCLSRRRQGIVYPV